MRAIALIEAHPISFAVLDFKLGAETSAGVAGTGRGVPFAFATGYGEALDVPETLGHIAIIKKLYNVPALGATIAAVLPGGGGAGD